MIYMVTPNGDKYPHMIKENHKRTILEDSIDKIGQVYMKEIPPDWTIEIEYKYLDENN